MPYHLRGVFLEACDCQVMCPCWFDRDPHEGECTGMIGWHVESGDIDGLDVAGLSVVSISYHGGNRKKGRWRVALFVDDNADAKQEKALTAVFTGERGGPLGELADLTGKITSVQRVPIKTTNTAKGTTLSAGKAVKVDMAPLVGTTERITTLADSSMSVVLSSVAEVGASGRLRFDLQGEGFDLDVHGRSANRGRFSYTMTGRAPRSRRTPATKKSAGHR